VVLGARVTGRAAPSDSAALLVIAVCAAHRLDGDVRASGERMVSRARSMSAVRRRTTANDLPMGSGMSSSDPRPGRTSLRASSDCCTRVRPSSAESSPVTVATRSASRANCSTVKVRRTAEGNLATTCARCSRPTVSTRSAGRTRSAVTGRERKSRSLPNRSERLPDQRVQRLVGDSSGTGRFHDPPTGGRPMPAVGDGLAEDSLGHRRTAEICCSYEQKPEAVLHRTTIAANRVGE